MSWLYSIVFAGLLFSSNSDTTFNKSNEFQFAQVPTTVSAVLDETEKFEQTYPLNPNGRVSVSNVNGSIVIEAWDRNEVKLEATKTADSKETLSEVDIKIESKPDSLSVETDYNNLKWNDRGERNKHRNIEVQFRLSVPRTALLNEIETVNGSVTVSNFVNLTKISAVNGNVTASNLQGAANLSTVNGEVLADFDRLATGSKISLSTVNGRVNLTIPSDANATIKADSLNGGIINDFGLPVRKGQYVGRDMYGRLGSGEVQIRLNSVNGGLAVGRKNDGKTPNPTTNLLPQKNKGNKDWDDGDDESMINSEQINREVARAARDSAKVSAAAIAEAQKEMARIKPELARISAEALSKTQIELNSEAIQAQINAGLAQKDAVLAQLRSANWFPGPPFVEKKTNTFQVKDIPKVVIDAKGCGVSVRGWDKAEVKYVLTEFEDSRNRTPATVTENQTSDGVNLKVVNNDKKESNDNRFYFGPGRLRIEVFVPKKSNLKVITDGEIRLDGVSGDIDLDGGNESINIRDVDGTLRLAANDGQVRVIGFKGEFDSETVDGDVYLEGDFSKLSAKAIDGVITLTLPATANATVTSNTKIETEGVDISDQKDRVLRFGSGSVNYKFDFVDGRLIVRNPSVIYKY